MNCLLCSSMLETYFAQLDSHVIMDGNNGNRMHCIVYPGPGHALTSTVQRLPLVQQYVQSFLPHVFPSTQALRDSK